MTEEELVKKARAEACNFIYKDDATDADIFTIAYCKGYRANTTWHYLKDNPLDLPEENANVIACIVVEKKKQCTYETYVELCRFAKPYGIESEECDFLDNLGEPISAWYDHFPKMVAWQYAPTFPKSQKKIPQ